MNPRMQDEGKDKETCEASLLLQFGLLQGSKNKGILDENQVYLDNCSTINAFKNSRSLSNIQKSGRPIRINCNAGTMVMKEEGTYRGLQVLNMPKVIAKISSMSKL